MHSIKDVTKITTVETYKFITQVNSLLSILHQLGSHPHVLDLFVFIKPGSQDGGVEAKPPALVLPVLQSAVGFLVQPADPLTVGENLLGAHHPVLTLTASSSEINNLNTINS